MKHQFTTVLTIEILLFIVIFASAARCQEATESYARSDSIADLSSASVDKTPIKYWGNSFSKKFHRPSCAFAQAEGLDHLVFFHFRKEAIDAGFTPCRWCLPPTWKTVKAVLLPLKSSTTTPPATTFKHQAQAP